MKRRIIMVSAMILLLGSQMQMFAQKKGGPDNRRPGMEIRDDRRPGGPMDKRYISQRDIERLQDFYWDKYRIRLSKKEAERILIENRRYGRDYNRYPQPPKGGKPEPKGPQKPPRK